MNKCFFSENEAKIVILANHDGLCFNVEPFGQYWITQSVILAYTGNNQLSKITQLNCLKETINLNREGLVPFWTFDGKGEFLQNNSKVVLRSIEEMKSRPLEHKEKDKKILDLLSRKLERSLNPFNFAHLELADRYSIGIFEDGEYVEWIRHLESSQLLALSSEGTSCLADSKRIDQLIDLISNYDSIKLTVKGWDYVHKISSTFNSKNVFIAMAFTDDTGQLLSTELRDIIKQTVEVLNWKPLVVSEAEYNDGIMDKIIASINESKFVIAELTHQKSGVYYEAGYAKGKGLPVIHVVKSSDLTHCHFDVKHLNLVVWENLPELRTKLENRIKATIT